MLRTSIQTTKIFEAFGMEDGFRIIHEAGFDGVDFTLIPFVSQGNAANAGGSIFDRTDEEICEFFRPYKETAAKYGVEFFQAHAPVRSLYKSEASNEYMLQVFEKCLMLCRYLNCPYLVVHPFFMGYDDALPPEEDWNVNLRGYTHLMPAAKKYGVTICLENMFWAHRGKIYGANCQDPDETNRYIDTLNGIAGEKLFAFCYDTGHSNLIGRDVCNVIRKLGDRIACLHIHDNDGWDDQHMAPYMGCLDWDRFIKGMREIGYRGELNFESHGLISTFDREIVPDVLSLTAATGRMFARRIAESD